MTASESVGRRIARLGALMAVAVAVVRSGPLDDVIAGATTGRGVDGLGVVVPVLQSALVFALGYVAVVAALAAASRLPVAGRWFARVARVLGGASAGALTVRVLGVSLSLASMASGPVAASEPPVMRPAPPDGDADSVTSLQPGSRRAVLAERVEDRADLGEAPTEGPAPTLEQAEEPGPAPPVLRNVGEAGSEATARPRPAPREAIGSGDETPVGAEAAPAVDLRPGVDPPQPEPADPVDGQHTVEAGESFWTIARDHMRDSGQRDVVAVAEYWVRLIEANQDRLVEPGNPDLIHVGQQLRLPR